MGNFEKLIVYQQALLIFDLNVLFCRQNLNSKIDFRTVEQMTQANRSGKQNIVEGSSEKSLKMNLTLMAVSRASYGELLEDYKDYLRARKLSLWEKDDTRLNDIRDLRISNENSKRWSNMTNWANWTNDPEKFANLMVTIINKQTFLLDKLVASLEKKFVEEGGYTENLSKKRLRYKKNINI